jgi:hypothetical protein
MSMSDTPDHPAGEADERRLTFKDRELVVALRRLANARSQVALLGEKLEQHRDGRGRPVAEEVDPVFIEFARRELAAAEEAYHQTLALPDGDGADDDGGDDDGALPIDLIDRRSPRQG